jgi:inhibitor of the pro-sigma K processing machinery
LELAYPLAILAILLLLFIAYKANIKPLKFLGNIVIKGVIGALFLFLLNLFGNQYSLHVPINLVTSFIAGLLGIPGVCALAAIQLWILS